MATQNRYDHRFRELVRATGKLDRALEHGFSYSTARGWLKTPPIQVVTIDVFDLEMAQLQQAVPAGLRWRELAQESPKCRGSQHGSASQDRGLMPYRPPTVPCRHHP